MKDNQHGNISEDVSSKKSDVKDLIKNGSIPVMTEPRLRLGGCILYPIDSSSKSEESRDGNQDASDDIDDDIKFDNIRQKLKHYLLNGKKMYVSKVTGFVSADIPEGGVAISIPQGKLSIIGHEDECKSNDIENSNWEIDELERVLFSDNRIRNAINEIINGTTSPPSDLSDSSVISPNLSEEEKAIFSYALICLKSRFNYIELKCIFGRINDFEIRFPDIANSLYEDMNTDQLLQLKRQILKVKLGEMVSEKEGPKPDSETSASNGTIRIPSSKGFFPMTHNYANAEDIKNMSKDENLRKKRELLKKRLIEGGSISLKPKDDITDSDQSIRIPRGGLF